MANENYEDFIKAYNHFSPHPLTGEFLKNFYVEDVGKDIVKDIITRINIAERFQKILIIGQTGCGKSTILNKIKEDLTDTYHVVSFSVTRELNIADIETADILFLIYLQLIRSVKHKDVGTEYLLKLSEELTEYLKEELDINAATGSEFMEFIEIKLKLESNFRHLIRKTFNSRMEALRFRIAEVCNGIIQHIQKDVLIIIDDLEKSDPKIIQKIFFDAPHLITLPDAKMIFTFPITAYSSPAFVQIADIFACEFIPLTHLIDMDGKYQKETLIMLMRLVLKRMNKKLITAEALKYMADKSGGVLRDLIKLSQDACKIAVTRDALIIDEDIAKQTARYKINEYERFFDFPRYEDGIRKIIKTHSKNEIMNEDMHYLLSYLFVLKYGRADDHFWYNVHPCLRECLK